MALTNAQIVGAWSLQSQNTALQGRYLAGALLMQANPTSSGTTAMGKWRAGVITSSSFGGTLFDGKVQAKATPSLSLDVLPFAGVVDRPSQGPYVAWANATMTVTTAAADATNPRRDLIVMRVYDQVIGDIPATAAWIEVITGVAAPSPATPATPAGAIALGYATVTALATTITNAQIVDLRKSTATIGSVRRLLPGDALSDQGFYDGELRDSGSGIDRWTDATVAWAPMDTYGNVRGQIARTDPTFTPSFPANAETVCDNLTFTAVAGRTYKVSFQTRFSTTGAGPVTWRMRWVASAGPIVVTSTQFFETVSRVDAGGVNAQVCFFKSLTGLPAGTVTVGVTALSNSSSGATTVNGPAGALEREFLVECIK